MSGKTRSLYGTAFKHFINSLKPKQNPGAFIGTDSEGNKYYEIAADPSRGKRHPKRWIKPISSNVYNQKDLPTEWDAWLRNTRADPPTESEIQGNLTLATITKENADKIAEKEGRKVGAPVKHTDMSSFPVYEEYEVTPGDKEK